MAGFTQKSADGLQSGERGPDDPTMDGRGMPLLFRSEAGAPVAEQSRGNEGSHESQRSVAGDIYQVAVRCWNSMQYLLARSGFVSAGPNSIDERLKRGEQVFLSPAPADDAEQDIPDYVAQLEAQLLNMHSLQQFRTVSAADATMHVHAFIARHRSLEYPGRGERKEVSRHEAAPTTKQWGYRMVTFSNGTVLVDILPVAQENVLPVHRERKAA
ncbi:hypothetical protein HZA87_06025 [Candidatus Uhrbacteria bacterium]|nr:hypothetical protein [Candidatus Uhrbacteria bacterium]